MSSDTGLKLENSLSVHQFTFSLIQKASIQIKAVQKWETKKLDFELVKSVCKFVRDEIDKGELSKLLSSKQASNLDKVEIIKQIFKETFDLTDEELSQIESHIISAIENKLVKSKPFQKFLKKLGLKKI